MSIDFDNSRWDDLLKDYCLWWDDKRSASIEYQEFYAMTQR